ncbi:hypothetical protein GGR53DRAFT_490428 [Hypoxylon sp. FL1150]|nr:hypothetical protein GGR53DRAFT_490428 [Hypoxylon sp. FL1150]
MLNLIDRLENLRTKFFPTANFDPEQRLNREEDVSADEDEGGTGNVEKPQEPTMLWHDNISLDNILVDENGVLRGIIDWECVSCIPLYEACQFPAFLHQARDRYVEPRTPYRVTRTRYYTDQDFRTYDIELTQHHLTMLRRLFLAEMRDNCPEWLQVFQSRGDWRDYEAAIQNCDNEFAYEMVERWVTSVEDQSVFEEGIWRLHELLMG